MCAMWATGHRKDDNDCLAKVKVVDRREQCSTTSSLSSAHGAEARAVDEGVWNTPETVEGTKEDCPSKLVGELGTVSCVSGESNSLELPQIFLCGSTESLLHIFGPENFTCVAVACSNVPNLDDSVVSDCGDTQLRTGDGHSQVRAGLCTRCRRHRANVLLPARWCCARNTACLRAFVMFSVYLQCG